MKYKWIIGLLFVGAIQLGNCVKAEPPYQPNETAQSKQNTNEELRLTKEFEAQHVPCVDTGYGMPCDSVDYDREQYIILSYCRPESPKKEEITQHIAREYCAPFWGNYDRK